MQKKLEKSEIVLAEITSAKLALEALERLSASGTKGASKKLASKIKKLEKSLKPIKQNPKLKPDPFLVDARDPASLQDYADSIARWNKTHAYTKFPVGDISGAREILYFPASIKHLSPDEQARLLRAARVTLGIEDKFRIGTIKAFRRSLLIEINLAGKENSGYKFFTAIGNLLEEDSTRIYVIRAEEIGRTEIIGGVIRKLRAEIREIKS